MKYKKKKLFVFFTLSSALIALSIFYVNKNYLSFNGSINTIKIQTNKATLDRGIPIMYANKENNPSIDFTKTYRFQRKSDSVIQISNLDIDPISKFRIYFEVPGDSFKIEKIEIFNKLQSHAVQLDEIKKKQKIKIHGINYFDVQGINGFIEYPFIIVDSIPYLHLFLVISFLVVLIGGVVFFTSILDCLFETDKKNYIFILFLISIYLNAPIYNITLILGLLYYIKSFDWNVFKENKINFLIIVFFLIYLVNVILIQDYNSPDFSTVERFLPFIFIPILMASVKIDNAIYFLMLSALFICIYLFSIAVLNLILLHNIEYLSFSEFSDIYHPVYLSYLVFFSICYLQLYYPHRDKYIIELFLFVSLVFLGSKLVLIIALPLYFLVLFKSKKSQISFLFFLIAFFVIVSLFKPIRDRFSDVLEIQDITILQEDKINNPNDPRINGLTLRLILWREAIKTIEGASELVFGNGVSKFKRDDLRIRMDNLGFKYQSKFNPHNQYINTFWETGLLGLLCLILILAESFKMSRIDVQNKLLLIFVIFFILSMLSESIFGRVRGIYIFTTLILILTNTNFNYIRIKNQYK